MVASRTDIGAEGAAAERGAFERFVLPEIEALLRVARGLTRNDADAEDLVQDTLLRAYRSIDHFDGRHPRAWLFTILRNAHVNHHRRRRPTLLRDGNATQRADRLPGGDGPDAHVDRGLDADVELALRTLTPPFRQAVALVDLGGLSYAEAARVLDVAGGTVMSRLHRARRNLRQQLVDRRRSDHDAPPSDPPADPPADPQEARA